MARDDFTKTTIETLAKRVGNRCSNPNCRAATTGPHSNDEKNINVGVAAHITAASPDGPRYNKSLTPEQRKAISNGIWLCQSCSKLVDNDAERYPIDLLQNWKTQAEDAALAELERRQIEDNPESHSIRFAVDDWNTWRERGSLPGDDVVIVSGWTRGDVRYGCTLRFRNDQTWEDQLHDARMEYRTGDKIVFTDTYAIRRDEIVLPPRRWISVSVGHGCHNSDEVTMPNADSIWFAAETVGDNQKLTWKVADIEFASIRLKN